MQSQSQDKIIAGAERVLKIIWIAFMAGAVSYMVIGTFVVQSLAPRGVGPADALPVPLPLIFGLLALAEIVAIQVLPGFLFAEQRLQSALRTGPQPERMSRLGIAEPGPGDSALVVLLTQYSNGKVLLWALAESIAVYGIILTFVLQSTTWLYPFAVVGLLFVAMGPPRVRDFLQDNRALLRSAG